MTVENATNTAFYCCDANGNVTDLVDTNGTVVAHREYDAFGNTIVATGAMVNDFNFWFSTKYLDQATGLYYYGYRYYDPVTGRWISEDPSGEKGGANLYAFVLNMPTDAFDIYGLKWHYTRDGARYRATVWADSSGDTFERLAYELKMDRTSRYWLKDENGAVAGTITPCKKYTVPNKVIVVLGWYNIYNYAFGLPRQAQDVNEAYESAKFATVFIDENSSYVSSLDIGNMASDLWGIALFGHGGDKGELTLKYATLNVGMKGISGVEDRLTTSSFAGYNLGSIIAFMCHADQGQWGQMVASGGTYYGGVGVQNLSIHPDWNAWVKSAIPDENN